MTGGDKFLLLTIKLASRSTARLNGGSGHRLTLASDHLGNLSAADSIQSLWAYDGRSYA